MRRIGFHPPIKLGAGFRRIALWPGLRSGAAKQRSLRETDTVARPGGDEFAIIQCAADQPQGRVREPRDRKPRVPCMIGERKIEPGASIGIALARSSREKLQRADLAFHRDRANADGRGTYRFFESAMDCAPPDSALAWWRSTPRFRRSSSRCANSGAW